MSLLNCVLLYMFAIEKAVSKHWYSIWIETDSSLVTKAFQDNMLVPWGLRNRWNNCMIIASSISCKCTHIHREGNQVAHALAKKWTKFCFIQKKKKLSKKNSGHNVPNLVDYID